MVCDALRAADRSLHFTANVHDPQHFVKLDDGLLRTIRNFDALVPDAAHSAEYEGLREAQAILDRLEKRQLYRCGCAPDCRASMVVLQCTLCTCTLIPFYFLSVYHYTTIVVQSALVFRPQFYTGHVYHSIG